MNRVEIEKIQRLADKNLAASITHRNKLSVNGKCIKNDKYMIYTLGIDNMDGHLNGVLCLNASNPEEVLDEAERFFEKDQRMYAVWIRDHADKALEIFLKAKGYEPLREPGSAGMAIHESIKNVKVPEGYTLKKVIGIKDVEDYAKVIQAAFNKSGEVSDEMYSHEAILIGNNVSAFVLYEDDRPVAAATTVVTGNVAGIYYLGTIEEVRGKGIGAYMTSVATNAGFDMGADFVILQASLVGENVYRRLGYQVFTYYRWYLIT